MRLKQLVYPLMFSFAFGSPTLSAEEALSPQNNLLQRAGEIAEEATANSNQVELEMKRLSDDASLEQLRLVTPLENSGKLNGYQVKIDLIKPVVGDSYLQVYFLNEKEAISSFQSVEFYFQRCGLIEREYSNPKLGKIIPLCYGPNKEVPITLTPTKKGEQIKYDLKFSPTYFSELSDLENMVLRVEIVLGKEKLVLGKKVEESWYKK